MNDRFEVGARLGHGDMGIVYEAWDRVASRAVALKVYRQDDDVTLLRVRRIFERLRGLRHRNVVELLELVEEADGPVLVMERVDGEDMMAYCAGRWRSERPSDGRGAAMRCDLGRLRSCLVQLVAGLIELHRRDVIHRDLKPSNLRVTPEGRLVILDFSLSDDRSATGHSGGTVPYMAPEQAMIDASIGPGADWYAVGAIAYEALTGRPPFTGPPQRVLQDKAAREPTPVEQLATDAPRDLVELCRRLLVPDPDRRPADAELRTLIGLGTPRRRTPMPTAPPKRQLRAMEHVIDRLRVAVEAGRAGLVALSGEHGIGRTTALAAIAEQIHVTWPEAMVLSLRAAPSAEGDLLDDLGGRLATAWAALPDAEQQAILPAKIGALLSLLPGLGIVPAIGALPEEPTRRTGAAAVTDAIDALRELLTMLSRRRPLALLVDDLDELDADAARVLADGLRGPDPPPVLLVGTCASEAALPAIERLIPVPLEWWSRKEIDQLVSGLGLAAAMQRSIVERCEGNPALALELVRSEQLGEIPPDGGLVEVYAARIAKLSPGARALLIGAALVPGGAPAAILARALGLERAAFDAQRAPLEAAGLITAHGAAARIAPTTRAVTAALGEIRDQAGVHGLARGLAVHGEELPAALRAALWRLADERANASRDAAEAAARAAQRLRYVAAAEAYGLAIETGREDLYEVAAEASAAAGRGAEAAARYAEASKRADGDARLRSAVRAAELHILAGELDAGVDAYRHALGLTGLALAPTPGRALPRLLMRRAWLRVRGVRFDARARTELPPFDLARADACFSAGIHLGVLETVIGAELQSRALGFALRLGDPERLGFSAVLESAFLAAAGAARRAERLLDLARATAQEVGSIRLAAFVEFGHGALQFFHFNRFVTSFTFLETVLASSETEEWTREMAHTYGCFCLCYLGDIHELTRRVMRLVRAAERRGDRYGAMVLQVRTNLAWLARGDEAGADEALASAERHWPFDAARFRVPDYYWLYGRAERALWAGDAASASRLLNAGLPLLEKSMLTRVHHVRAETQYLVGRAALAAAPPGSARKAAGKWSRRIRGNVVGISPTLAALIDGCAALRDGDAEHAATALRTAIDHADAIGLGLHGAAARVRLGELIGGDEGAAARDRGLHDLARLGVTDVARTVHLFAPR